MEYITIRLYFEYGKKINELSFLKKIFHQGFSHFIIKQAKQAGIKQAICFNVSAGYLSHHEGVQWGHSDCIPNKHPQCIELTDEEEKIMLFLKKHKKQLSDVDVVLVGREVISVNLW